MGSPAPDVAVYVPLAQQLEDWRKVAATQRKQAHRQLQDELLLHELLHERNRIDAIINTSQSPEQVMSTPPRDKPERFVNAAEQSMRISPPEQFHTPQSSPQKHALASPGGSEVARATELARATAELHSLCTQAADFFAYDELRGLLGAISLDIDGHSNSPTPITRQLASAMRAQKEARQALEAEKVPNSAEVLQQGFDATREVPEEKKRPDELQRQLDATKGLLDAAGRADELQRQLDATKELLQAERRIRADLEPLLERSVAACTHLHEKLVLTTHQMNAIADEKTDYQARLGETQMMLSNAKERIAAMEQRCRCQPRVLQGKRLDL